MENHAFWTADRYLAGMFINQGYDLQRIVIEAVLLKSDGRHTFQFKFPAYGDFSVEYLRQLAGSFYASRIHVEALSFTHAVKKAFGLIADAVRQAKSAGDQR